MRWIFGRTAMWLFATVGVAAVALAAGRAQLPDGPGKKLLEERCTVCHDVDSTVATEKMDKAGWDTLVKDMKQKGAELSDTETATLVDYLAKNFGVGAPAAGQAAQAGGGDGKKILEDKCTLCHDLDLVSSQHLDKDGWQMIVNEMKDKGADVSDKDTPTLVDYLVKTYGK